MNEATDKAGQFTLRDCGCCPIGNMSSGNHATDVSTDTVRTEEERATLLWEKSKVEPRVTVGWGVARPRATAMEGLSGAGLRRVLSP